MGTTPNTREVKITVTLPGQYIEVTRARGFGDNPRFFANQVEEALDSARETLRGNIEAGHGTQEEPPMSAPAVLHSGITDAQVEAARNAMVRVDSVYLPAKIIRRALEAAFAEEPVDA